MAQGRGHAPCARAELRPSPWGCGECGDGHPSPEQGRRISPGTRLTAGISSAARRAQKSPVRDQGWAGSPALQIKALSSDQSPNPALIPQRTHMVQSRVE